MDRDRLVRVPPWGVVLGYKLRRALIVAVSLALGWTIIQIALALIWMQIL